MIDLVRWLEPDEERTAIRKPEGQHFEGEREA
jgi:hypothetical protein